MAVTHALTVLGWQENLLSEEMPPEWMWPFTEELEEWFEEVTARRRDGTSRDVLEDAPDMVENTLTRGRK